MSRLNLSVFSNCECCFIPFSSPQNWVSSLIFVGPLDLSFSNPLLYVYFYFFLSLVVRMVKWIGDLCNYASLFFPGCSVYVTSLLWSLH